MSEIYIRTSAHACPWVSFPKNLTLDGIMESLLEAVHWSDKSLSVEFKSDIIDITKDQIEFSTLLNKAKNENNLIPFSGEKVYYLAENIPFVEGDFYILTDAFLIEGGLSIPVLTMKKTKPRSIEIQKRTLVEKKIKFGEIVTGTWLAEKTI